jgi:hypothetical protein
MQKYANIKKEVVKVARRLFSEVNPQEYFDQHKEMTLQFLMDTLNPDSRDTQEETERKMISRFIAEAYFEKYNKKPLETPERNLAIITYQYFIYRNFGERFSYLKES